MKKTVLYVIAGALALLGLIVLTTNVAFHEYAEGSMVGFVVLVALALGVAAFAWSMDEVYDVRVPDEEAEEAREEAERTRRTPFDRRV